MISNYRKKKLRKIWNKYGIYIYISVYVSLAISTILCIIYNITPWNGILFLFIFVALVLGKYLNR